MAEILTSERTLPAKKRRTRRNYQQELHSLKGYCEVWLDILKHQAATDFAAGQTSAFERVVSKIGEVNGR